MVKTTIVHKIGRKIVRRGDSVLQELVNKSGVTEHWTIIIQHSFSAAKAHRTKKGYTLGICNPYTSTIYVFSKNLFTTPIINTLAHELGHAAHYTFEYADYAKCSHLEREHRANEYVRKWGYSHNAVYEEHYQKKDNKRK